MAVFRWSLFGEKKASLVELLRHSVGTFRQYFGGSSHYVVCTDDPAEVRRLLPDSIELIDIGRMPVAVEGNCRLQWRKWDPAVRLFPGETEVYIDCDIFIVGDAFELKSFCDDARGDGVMALAESVPSPRLFGMFKDRVPSAMPAINSGLVVQQPHANFTDSFELQRRWWLTRIEADPELARVPHYEQGAVAAALGPYFTAGKLGTLPVERYKMISPRSNPHLTNLDGVALIHTTFRTHPGFRWFHDEIVAKSDYKEPLSVERRAD